MIDPEKPKRGGKRQGAGRKATGKGEILPWRFRAGTIARVEAAAIAAKRSPGETARDALDMGLPTLTSSERTTASPTPGPVAG